MFDQATAAELTEIRQRLGAVVSAFDPDDMIASDANQVVETAARIERLAAMLKTLAMGRVTDAGTWRGQGHRSAEDWLAAKTGTSTGEAKSTVDTARSARNAPRTEKAIREGKLSPAQAKEVAAAAAVDPSAERRLLDHAENRSLAELRDECARTRAAADPDPEATHRRIHRNRYVRTRKDVEGAWRLEARGTTADGARIMAALRRTADRIFRGARAEGRREPSEAYLFDALTEHCTTDDPGAAAPPSSNDRVADDAAASMNASEPSAPAKSPAPVRRPAGADAKIIVRIDHAALLRGHTVEGEICEISGIGPVPVSVVREWMNDAFLAAIVTHGVDIRRVVHLGRRPTVLQRTALQWLSPGCSRVGCGRSARLEIDHDIDWTVTHTTCLDTLDPLCDHDHDLKTRSGWALELGTGKRRLLPPDHPDHPGSAQERQQRANGPPGAPKPSANEPLPIFDTG